MCTDVSSHDHSQQGAAYLGPDRLHQRKWVRNGHRGNKNPHCLLTAACWCGLTRQVSNNTITSMGRFSKNLTELKLRGCEMLTDLALHVHLCHA